MGRADSSGPELENTRGRHKGALHPLSLMLGHYPCSLYSVKLGIFLCKKKVFIKKPSLSEWHMVAFSHKGCCGGQ